MGNVGRVRNVTVDKKLVNLNKIKSAPIVENVPAVRNASYSLILAKSLDFLNPYNISDHLTVIFT